METTTIAKIFADYEKFLDKKITLNGRVKSVRDSKTFGFIELNDGSYLKNIQVVFDDSLTNFAAICKLGVGAAISVDGKLVKSQ
jgi:asparaginyl-tRNA synthetase